MLEGARVATLEFAPALGDVVLDATGHLGADPALAQPGGHDGHEAVAREADPPGQRHDHGGSEAGHQQQEQARRRVGHEVHDEAQLEPGGTAGLAVGPLLAGGPPPAAGAFAPLFSPLGGPGEARAGPEVSEAPAERGADGLGAGRGRP